MQLSILLTFKLVIRKKYHIYLTSITQTTPIYYVDTAPYVEEMKNNKLTTPFMN